MLRSALLALFVGSEWQEDITEEPEPETIEESSSEERLPIDPSLSALGDVVKALADNPFGRIPYKGSMLTQALKVVPVQGLISCLKP